MYHKRILCFLATLCIVASAVANEVVEEVIEDEHDAHQNNIIPLSTAQPRLDLGDLSLPNSLMGILANGGAVAAFVLFMGAVAMLLGNSFTGLRFCSLLGNCGGDPTAYQAYSSSPNAVYADYQGYQQGTFNSPVYQKRSLEYVGPILKALGNAVERYSRQVTQKPADVPATTKTS